MLHCYCCSAGLYTTVEKSKRYVHTFNFTAHQKPDIAEAHSEHCGHAASRQPRVACRAFANSLRQATPCIQACFWLRAAPKSLHVPRETHKRRVSPSRTARCRAKQSAIKANQRLRCSGPTYHDTERYLYYCMGSVYSRLVDHTHDVTCINAALNKRERAL